jgi:hypothetical protein
MNANDYSSPNARHIPTILGATSSDELVCCLAQVYPNRMERNQIRRLCNKNVLTMLYALKLQGVIDKAGRGCYKLIDWGLYKKKHNPENALRIMKKMGFDESTLIASKCVGNQNNEMQTPVPPPPLVSPPVVPLPTVTQAFSPSPGASSLLPPPESSTMKFIPRTSEKIETAKSIKTFLYETESQIGAIRQNLEIALKWIDDLDEKRESLEEVVTKLEV